MIARCRERGLGTMTWEVARHLRPAKVLVVARDDVDFVDEERFPGARWTKQPQRHNAMAAVADGIPDEDLDWLLTDVDVLYTAETPYDFRLFDEARARGVGTVLHGMWEYLPYRRTADLPRPDLFASPSLWCLERWPRPCQVLPVPVAADRFPHRQVDRVETIVHCAGARAGGDRNGTNLVLAALPLVKQPVRVIIRTQQPVRRTRLPSNVELLIEPAREHYWQVFDGADAALLPRRYGGLSLPLQEASALGLPVIGLEREAGTGYGHAAVVSCRERSMRLPAGPVMRADASPRRLAAVIDRLVADPERAQEMAAASTVWARRHSWEALKPAWCDVLGRLAA